MEYYLPQLLARDEIIHTLNERQLKIPNISSLSHQELLSIYATFAIPLAKRDPSKGNLSTRNGIATTNSALVEVASHRFVTKRHATVDVQNVHLESLNINDENGFSKRTKVSDEDISAKIDIFTENAKKRKIITWP